MVLTEIRDACRRMLAGFAESMSYGMPADSRDGTAEIAWASQKRYISLYVMRADVLNVHRGQLSGLDAGKGCIRYRSPAAVDFTVIHSMLTAVAASRDSGLLNCPATPGPRSPIRGMGMQSPYGTPGINVQTGRLHSARPGVCWSAGIANHL